jgi:Rps23 Pro-64 3,4-dihydroxylase Tpa1-like proline 4-hydroxylase
MKNLSCINFLSLDFENDPFPHFSSTAIFSNGLDSSLFDWFEETDEWQLVATEFYEQYEFSFFNVDLPAHLKNAINPEAITAIRMQLEKSFNVSSLDLVGITAHKLIHGHHIGIHNDYIGGEETHRLVVHLSPNWDESKGGFFMLFNSDNAEDVDKIIRPLSNTAIGFEISKISNHAVSKIYDFSRYTIVYTFSAKEAL